MNIVSSRRTNLCRNARPSLSPRILQRHE